MAQHELTEFTPVRQPDAISASPGHEFAGPPQAAYAKRLSLQGNTVAEIAERQEVLAQAGAELIDKFAIQPSLFEDEGRSLIFTALADRWATSREVEMGGG